MCDIKIISASAHEKMTDILKTALRTKIRRVLNAKAATDIEIHSVALGERLRQLPIFKDARGVSCFISMPSGEVQTAKIVHMILSEESSSSSSSDSTNDRNSKRLFIPKVTGKSSDDMVMWELNSLVELESCPKNKWGIPELIKSDFDATIAGVIDLVLVPGVVFDLTGQRIGHGKGYYDSFLKRLNAAHALRGLPRPPTVGLCFDEQVLPADQNVPVEDHDVQLDFIVTPSRVITGGS